MRSARVLPMMLTWSPFSSVSTGPAATAQFTAARTPTNTPTARHRRMLMNHSQSQRNRLNSATSTHDPPATIRTGLAALEPADLMVILTRWRNLPDEQMKYVDEYVKAGKPIVGLRTATHAFKLPKDSAYARYTWDNKDESYRDGFGRQIIGETWY